MKPLHQDEIQLWVSSNQSLVGGRLQEIRSFPPCVALGIYAQSKLHWVVLDLAPACPLVLTWDSVTLPKSKATPVGLFLNSHFRGHVLRELARDEQIGRGIRMDFGPSSALRRLEVRLFPHGQNLIARCEDKTISSHRVQDLPQPRPTEGVREPTQTPVLRSPLVWAQEWQGLREKTAAPAAPRSDVREKKQNSLEKLKRNLAQAQKPVFSDIGHWLKEHQTLQVPEVWSKWIDSEKSLAENIQLLFEADKKWKEKNARNLLKVQKLEDELARAGPIEVGPKKELTEIEGKGYRRRDWILPSGTQLIVYRGRSGDENLELLRRAQPWDLWLHLKDHPGSHGILRRPRGFAVPEDILETAAQWLITESPQARRELRPGDFVEVLCSEVRFVQPLRGASPGRVSLKQARTLRLRFDPSRS